MNLQHADHPILLAQLEEQPETLRHTERRRISHGRRSRTVTVCDKSRTRAGTPGAPQAHVSVKQKRHGEDDSVTVTIAEEFRSAS